MKITLTKDEFIVRSMAGERFRYEGRTYHYDNSFINPFRVEEYSIGAYWGYIDGKNIFEILEPEPKIERRWKWRRNSKGRTDETSSYLSDTYAESHNYEINGWYKIEDCYIDVEVK